MENPLIVHNRKFDIRVWVLVSSWVPLKIWIHEQSYLRLSAQDYDASDVKNKYIHLTNNSIVKKHENFHNSKIPGNMMNIN